MVILESKILRKKKIDKELSVKVIKNDASERLFVEFVSKDNKLIMQKSFQNTYHGRLEAETFEKSFQSIEEFRDYFQKKNNRSSQ